ncbi:hypothetical protein DFH09DRAFT_1325729 [Mycena vulgaris]|nr:hypothetical protein DFH09DRAFT_1325729 [Mycena vulgaris]
MSLCILLSFPLLGRTAGGRAQIKEAESSISRTFGGKFRSTLRAAAQKDSVIIEALRALRIDI